MSHPVIASLFLSDYLMPLWDEWGEKHLLELLDYDNFSPPMKAFSDWLCLRFCGMGEERPNVIRPADNPGGDSAKPSDEDLDKLCSIHKKFSEMPTIHKALQSSEEPCVLFSWRIKQQTLDYWKGSQQFRFDQFEELWRKCGNFAKYLFTPMACTNSHGNEEKGYQIFPIDAAKFLDAFRSTSESLGLRLENLSQPSDKYRGQGEFEMISFEGEEVVADNTDVVSCSLPEKVNLKRVEEKLRGNGPVYSRDDQVRAYCRMVRIKPSPQPIG